MTSLLTESRILVPGTGSFVVALLLHLLIRVSWRRSPVLGPLLVSLATGGAVCSLWLWAYADRVSGSITAGEAITALVIYAALSSTYIDFHGHHFSSVRLVALQFMARQGGTAREAQLHRACGIEATVDERLSRYVRIGEVKLEKGRYYLAKTRILRVSRTYQAIRRVLLGPGKRAGARG